MPTVPRGPRYNKDFIAALLQAHVLEKKTMSYKGNTYVVKDHIKEARRDIEDGWYTVDAKPGSGHYFDYVCVIDEKEKES